MKSGIIRGGPGETREIPGVIRMASLAGWGGNPGETRTAPGFALLVVYG